MLLLQGVKSLKHSLRHDRKEGNGSVLLLREVHPDMNWAVLSGVLRPLQAVRQGGTEGRETVQR